MNPPVTVSQFNRIVFCGILVAASLYFGRSVLIPLTFSIFFAMLFARPATRMERAGLQPALAALLCMLILVIVLAGIALLVFFQGKQLADEAPKIEERGREALSQLQAWISAKFDVTEQKQNAMIAKQLNSAASGLGKVLTDFLKGLAGLLGSMVMVLIFSFLLLLQRSKYESFLIRVFDRGNAEETRKVLQQISQVSQRYLTGRALSIVIFTVLFGVGFLIVGLKGAILLAFVAALLTIVPYVGSIAGGLFPFAVALVTDNSTQTAFGALAVVVVVQAIDNYFIEPYVIGGEVNISAFFTLLILLIGGLLWGVAGMILFLPMLAVARIVFDAVPPLAPYGYLVGDQETGKPSTRLLKKIRQLFGKK